METPPLELNGDWTYKIKLPKLNTIARGYSHSHYAEGENLEFDLFIEDELSDDPDPIIEQLNTLNYIFKHQDELLTAICKRALEEIPEVIENSDLYEDELEVYNSMDAIKIQDWISISDITISSSYKDGYAYFSMSGGIEWEPEHGLSIHFHKNRIIYFGYWTDYIDVEQDGGVSRDLTDDDIKVYAPHPKYNKLKPSQEEMNKRYASTLISKGMNERYISDVAKGIIDIHSRLDIGNFTHLEYACKTGNYELIQYLLTQKLPIEKALQTCWNSTGYLFSRIDKISLEMLLQAGADINFQDTFSKVPTLLHIRIIILVDHMRRRSEYIGDGLHISTADIEMRVEIIKQDIEYLIQKGADIDIKDYDGKTCLDLLNKLSSAERTPLIEWMRALYAQSNKGRNSTQALKEKETTQSLHSQVKKPWWRKLF